MRSMKADVICRRYRDILGSVPLWRQIVVAPSKTLPIVPSAEMAHVPTFLGKSLTSRSELDLDQNNSRSIPTNVRFGCNGLFCG